MIQVEAKDLQFHGNLTATNTEITKFKKKISLLLSNSSLTAVKQKILTQNTENF